MRPPEPIECHIRLNYPGHALCTGYPEGRRNGPTGLPDVFQQSILTKRTYHARVCSGCSVVSVTLTSVWVFSLKKKSALCPSKAKRLLQAVGLKGGLLAWIGWLETLSVSMNVSKLMSCQEKRSYLVDQSTVAPLLIHDSHHRPRRCSKDFPGSLFYLPINSGTCFILLLPWGLGLRRSLDLSVRVVWSLPLSEQL